MTATTTREHLPGTTDEQVLAGRLAWLARAATEQEAHLIESALLARTDNGPQDDDPEPEGER